MKFNSPLHFFFTLPVCFVFLMMSCIDMQSKNPGKTSIKYLDTSINSRELTQLITISNALNDPVFDKVLGNALKDNKITVNEMTELRTLADETAWRIQGEGVNNS